MTLKAAISLISLFLLSIPAFADHGRKVRVGISQNPPLAIQRLDGKPEGLAVDVMDDIAAQNHWTLEYVQDRWPRLLERLEKGELDIQTGIAYSKERARRFDFSDEAIASNWGVVYRNKEIDIDSAPGLQGKRLALVPKATHSEILVDLLKKFGVTYTAIPAKNYAEALQFIDEGKADAAVVSRLFGILHAGGRNVVQTTINFNPVEIRFASANGANGDVLAAIDLYLSVQKTNTDSRYHQFLNRWMNAPNREKIPVWIFWTIGGIAAFLCGTWINVAWLRRKIEIRTKELRESEERFRAFADYTPNKIHIKDTEGRYILVNRKSEKLFGLTNEEAKGKTSAEIFPPEIGEPFGAHDLDVIKTGAPIEEEEEFLMDDGVHTYLTVKFPILGENGDIAAVGSSGLDITKRKQIQAQLIQSSKLATLGEMAAGMAHELNQPLNIINMTTEILLENVINDDASSEILTEKLTRISDQTARASAIINHMRIFGRTDSGVPEELDLRKALQGAVDLVKEEMRLSEIELSLDISETCPKVVGQQLPLEQVVLNLLRNASDAIGEKESDGTTPRRISIKITNDPISEEVRLAVQDTGGGVPDEVIDRIFEPFFTTKKVGEGTGLGLSISYGIITEMGGRLEITNIDEGAKFTIILPAANEASMRGNL